MPLQEDRAILLKYVGARLLPLLKDISYTDVFATLQLRYEQALDREARKDSAVPYADS
jgi:hypothetical protein